LAPALKKDQNKKKGADGERPKLKIFGFEVKAVTVSGQRF
jgi:hypothetical protein